MKTLAFTLITFMFSFHAHAFDLAEEQEFNGLPEEGLVFEDISEEDDGITTMRPGGPGGMSCAAYATRGERHREGHRDCRSCERMHRDCYQSCGRRTYQVEVIGQVANFGKVKVWKRWTAYGETRWQAEEKAMRECRWARADRCHVNRASVGHREMRRFDCR